MKFVIALLAGLSLHAHAQGGDQMLVLMTCKPAHAVPDLGMSLTVSQGGIAGLTQIQVQEFFLGHNTNHTYIVRQKEVEPGMAGAPMTFEGQGITLQANFTTGTLADGGHIGHLSGVESAFNNVDLSCKLASTAERVETVAKVSAVDREIEAVELLSNGQLKMQKFSGQVTLRQLDSGTEAQLLSLAQDLRAAALTKQTLMTCKLAVFPGDVQDLYVSDSSEQLRLVLASSCAISQHVFPTAQAQQQTALLLEEKLIILAKQAAGV
jgi:hypothetical protein